MNNTETNKTKAHIRYKNKAGKGVPGVTTILNILNKPALVPWANKLGLNGIDVKKYVDDKADIGTLAHYLVLCHLTGEEPDTSEYSQKQIDQAENCILSFLDWEKSNPIKPILLETPLVSEVYQFGGTIDIYADIRGDKVLIDLKTGKGIYDNMFYQLAAYYLLLKENGHSVDYSMILNIGRDETESFDMKKRVDLSTEALIFSHALSIYNLQNKKRRDGT